MPLKLSPPLKSVTLVCYIFVFHCTNRQRKFPKNTSCKYFLCTLQLSRCDDAFLQSITLVCHLLCSLHFSNSLLSYEFGKKKLYQLLIINWLKRRSHFLWQHLRFFVATLEIVYFYLTVRSPKLKVACTCNSIFFSTPGALFMQNTM